MSLFVNPKTNLGRPVDAIFSADRVLGNQKVNVGKKIGSRDTRKLALLEFASIEEAREYKCKCKDACSAKIDYGTVAQIRRDVMALGGEGPLSEMLWSENVMLRMIKSNEKGNPRLLLILSHLTYRENKAHFSEWKNYLQTRLVHDCWRSVLQQNF